MSSNGFLTDNCTCLLVRGGFSNMIISINAVHIDIQGAVITIPSGCDGYLTGS